MSCFSQIHRPFLHEVSASIAVRRPSHQRHRSNTTPQAHPLLRGNIRRRLLALCLLLILDQLNVILRNILVLLQKELLNILAQITLHRDLLAATRQLSHARARRKLLAKVLGHLLDIEAKRLEPADGGDVLALVALDALDCDFARGAGLGLTLLCGCGFVRFLGGVLFGAFLGFDGERGEVLRECFCWGVRAEVLGRRCEDEGAQGTL